MPGDNVGNKSTSNIRNEDIATFQFFFTGSDEAYGEFIPSSRAIKAGNKVEGVNATREGTPSLPHYINHLSGKKGLGIIPIDRNNECLFGVVDVDIYERGAISDILTILDNSDAPLIPFISKSGGLHLYLFMNHPIAASDMKFRLQTMINLMGFKFIYKKYNKPFTLEIFPKQAKLVKDKQGNLTKGSYINLPYYQKDSKRRAMIKNRVPVSFEEAMLHLRNVQGDISLQVVDDFIKHIPYGHAPPCIQVIETMKPDLEGSRNTYLFNIGVMLRKQFPDSWEHELHSVNNNMKTPIPEHELDSTIIASLSKDAELYSYKCTEEPCVNFCDKEECSTREYGIGKQDGYFSEIEYGQLTQYKGSEPYYEWEIRVKGGEFVKFSFNNESEIINQSKFLQICFRELKLLPNRIKQKEWTNILNNVLKNINIVEVASEEDISKLSLIKEAILDFIVKREKNDKRYIPMGAVFYNDRKEEFVFMRSTLITHIFNTQTLTKRIEFQELAKVFKFLGIRSTRRKFDDKALNVLIMSKIKVQQLASESSDSLLEEDYFEDEDESVTEEIEEIEHNTRLDRTNLF